MEIKSSLAALKVPWHYKNDVILFIDENQPLNQGPFISTSPVPDSGWSCATFLSKLNIIGYILWLIALKFNVFHLTFLEGNKWCTTQCFTKFHSIVKSWNVTISDSQWPVGFVLGRQSIENVLPAFISAGLPTSWPETKDSRDLHRLTALRVSGSGCACQRLSIDYQFALDFGFLGGCCRHRGDDTSSYIGHT